MNWLEKQDNMDGKIRILKSVDNEISNLQARLLEDQNTVSNMEILAEKRWWLLMQYGRWTNDNSQQIENL